MLLGDILLSAVASVWRYREKVEWEAAATFARLAHDLADCGAGSAVVQMARKAAKDEQRHAKLCQGLAENYDPQSVALVPELGSVIGPNNLPLDRRTLYASVALSCVTESLSVALLLRMRQLVVDEDAKATIREILVDEIDHSRLGWAHLAAEAARGDVSWLSPHIQPMLDAALLADAEHVQSKEPAATSPAAYGILPKPMAEQICHETIRKVIEPGLRRFGVNLHIKRV